MKSGIKMGSGAKKKPELLDKFIGCLLGLSIGDALGLPAEGKEPELIQALYGRITDYQKPHEDLETGTYSDDTEMSLIVAEHLIRHQALVLPQLAIDFVNQWAYPVFYSPETKYYGASCYQACQNIAELIKKKVPLEQIVHVCGVDSAGNGGAMRIAPLGLFFNEKEDQSLLKRAAIKVTKLTHNNNEAFAGAVAIAYAVAKLLHTPKIEDDSDSFSWDVANFISDLDSVTAEKIASLSFLSNPYYPHNSGRVRDSVPAAFFYFLKYPHDSERSIIEAVNFGGDADTIASMTGALSGAYNGLTAFPKRWINGLKNSDLIIRTAERLYLAQK